MPKALRPRSSSGAAWLVLAGVLRFAGAAHAEVAAALDGQVSLGAGHDSNALLDIVPAQGESPRADGFYGQVAPALSAVLVTGDKHRHRIGLGYQGDFRASNDFGYLLYQQGGVEYQSPAWRGLRIGIGFEGGLLATGEFPENDFRFLGGGLGLQAALGTRTRIDLAYSPEWRFGTAATAGRERLEQLDARLRVRVIPGFALGAFATHLALTPLASATTRTRLSRTRAGLVAEASWGRVSAWARGYAGQRSFAYDAPDTTPPLPSIPRPADEQTEIGLAAGVALRITDTIKLLAVYDSNHDVGGDGQAGNADRQNLGLALVVTGGVRRVSRPVPAGDTNLAPLVRGGRVRLRVRAPQAREVRVVGSFDDWGEGAALRPVPDQPGLWELWLPLPAGEHRYHLLVDGTTMKPPLAPRYVRDGFGGEDAVIDVPE